MKKMTLVQGLVAAAVTAVLMACGGGGAPYANNGNGGGTGSGSVITATDPSNTISISVGRGDTIEVTATDIKYRKRFAVTVSDTNGRPIKGAPVSVVVKPLAYFKGQWNSSGGGGAGSTPTVTQAISVACANEDTNGNNILDAGEDINNSGQLEPRIAQVVAGPENGVNTTDAQGVVYVIAEWAKSDASWIAFNLVLTTTGTSGATEVSVVARNTTGYAQGDESKPTSAFTYSPFGTSTSCTDTL